MHLLHTNTNQFFKLSKAQPKINLQLKYSKMILKLTKRKEVLSKHQEPRLFITKSLTSLLDRIRLDYKVPEEKVNLEIL